MTLSTSLLNYNTTPGKMTGTSIHDDLLTGLPRDIAGLCHVVQDNLVHVFWAERYSRRLSEDEKRTVGIRRVEEKLGLVREALNKIEILPWDYEIPVFRHPLEDPLPQDPVEAAVYDRIAALTLAGEVAFDAVRQEGEEAHWRIPDTW